ncbi:MAG: hypothetical protein GY898_26965 [Proteobacteria bacterium]|nr:hypothetical protein [Pseudomonadota bacterium]
MPDCTQAGGPGLPKHIDYVTIRDDVGFSLGSVDVVAEGDEALLVFDHRKGHLWGNALTDFLSAEYYGTFALLAGDVQQEQFIDPLGTESWDYTPHIWTTGVRGTSLNGGQVEVAMDGSQRAAIYRNRNESQGFAMRTMARSSFEGDMTVSVHSGGNTISVAMKNGDADWGRVANGSAHALEFLGRLDGSEYELPDGRIVEPGNSKVGGTIDIANPENSTYTVWVINAEVLADGSRVHGWVTVTPDGMTWELF